MNDFMWHILKTSALAFMIAFAIAEETRYMVACGFVLVYLEQLRTNAMIAGKL